MIKNRLYLIILVIIMISSGCASLEDGIFNIATSVARSRAGMVLKSVQTDDHKIAYLERESNGETIVMLHGFAASKDNWLFFANRIPKEYRLIAFDMPAHGDSSARNDTRYDVSSLTQGVAKAIDALNLKQFHILGNSLGGYIATLYAARNPEKIKTLGLFDAAGVYSPTPSEFQNLLEQGDNPLIVSDKQSFDRLVDFVFYKKPFMPWPAKPASLRKYLARTDLNRRVWNDVWNKRKDLTDMLSNLSMPVFILWGDKDRVLNISSIEVYKRYLPNAKVVILKDCGHAPMIERSKESAAAYLDFLKGK